MTLPFTEKMVEILKVNLVILWCQILTFAMAQARCECTTSVPQILLRGIVLC